MEKVANYADKAAAKIQQRKAMDIDSVLNKMKQSHLKEIINNKKAPLKGAFLIY